MASLDDFYDPSVDLSKVEDRANFSYPLALTQLLPHTLNCPYCLFSANTINAFTIWQEGKRSKAFRCPECKNTFLRKTLIRMSRMTLQEYATWLYWVKKYDIDRKIKWDPLFKRIKEARVSFEFWAYYREVKEKDLKYMQDAGIKPARDYAFSGEKAKEFSRENSEDTDNLPDPE